jgi:hypothetical protein
MTIEQKKSTNLINVPQAIDILSQFGDNLSTALKSVMHNLGLNFIE